MKEVVQVNVTGTAANWILGLALAPPAAIILFFQLPLMSAGSEQAAINVTIAVVMLVIGLAILTARRKVTLDPGAKTVSWTRHLFGLTWRRKTVPAEQIVAMAVVKERGRSFLRTSWLIDREGKRQPLQDNVSVHGQTVLERCARAMGWSVESDR
ncbi:MAG: hypothetical protein QM723_02620 [Myxococcaceae bacterium]